MHAPNLLPRLAPPLFVLIWATGFIVARLVAPHAEPLTFLSVRYLLAILVLGAVAAAARAPWPRSPAGWRDGLVAGVLLHGLYLGGVFWAVRHGLPAGIAALVAGLQPLATGLLVGPLLGERVSAWRWSGIAIGFLGAALVVAPKLGAADGLGIAAPLLRSACSPSRSAPSGRSGPAARWTCAPTRSCISRCGRRHPAARPPDRTGPARPGAGTLDRAPGRCSGSRSGPSAFCSSSSAVAPWRASRRSSTSSPGLGLMAYLLFGETLSPYRSPGWASATGVALASRG